MSRSRKGRKNCYSCRPGCRCDWCESADYRKDVRHGRVEKKSLLELVQDAEASKEYE